MAEVRVKQVRSANGSSPKQRATLQTLKLGRIGKSVTREDSDHLRGLVHKVDHLVEIEEVS